MAHTEFEGDTLQEAIGAAAAKLGIADEDVHYEIVDTGRRGLFGLGVRKVRIRVEAEGKQADKPQRAERTARGEPPQGQRRSEAREGHGERRPRRDRSRGSRRRKSGGRDHDGDESRPTGPAEPMAVGEPTEASREVEGALARMLELAGIELDIRAGGGDGGVRLDLSGSDRKLLTEKDGELISALQFLLNRMARRAFPDAGRIQVSCDGYRSARDEDVIELAREVAQQVSQTGKAKRLHPMNPYERRLVHMTVREYEGLTTRSEGDGFLKKIRIVRQR